jgi:hypothetical protein
MNTMRFRITNKRWRVDAFRFEFGDAVIEAAHPALSRWLPRAFSSGNEFTWTWLDGTQYSLWWRVSNLGTKPTTTITSQGQILSSGNLETPFVGRTRMEWSLDGDRLVTRGGSGRLTRTSDSKTLARWRQPLAFGRIGVEGVMRPRLSNAIVPLIFGIILFEILP